MSEPTPESGTTQQSSKVDDASTDAVPRHTTPTWESELLISGASVFGLLQLPPVIDAFGSRLNGQLASAWHPTIMLGMLYAGAVVYGLIITFLLHLATRAYWVALVGLRSVFPQGIRWDRYRSGSISREVLQKRYSDQDANIERADNFSTLVFAIGIALVVLAAFAIILALPPLIIGTLLQTRVWPLQDPSRWMMIMVALVIGPIVLFRIVDSVLGPRLRPDGRLARMIGSTYQTFAILGGQRVVAPLLFTLTTNITRKFGLMVIVVMLWLLVAGVSLLSVYHRDPTAIARLPMVGQILQTRQDSAFYADLAADAQPVPHIQSDIISGPFVRLWVPLDPHRQRAFASHCGALKPNAAASQAIRRAAQETTLANCLGGLFQVRLDGTAPSAMQWHFARDDTLGIDGLHVYFSARELNQGEHELIIAKPAADDADENDGLESWRIPFWR